MQFYIPALLVVAFVAKMTGYSDWSWLATAFLPIGFGLATLLLVVIPIALVQSILAVSTANALSTVTNNTKKDN